MTPANRRPAARIRGVAVSAFAAVALGFAAGVGAQEGHDHGGHPGGHDHGAAGQTVITSTTTLTTSDPAAMAQLHAGDTPAASPAAQRVAAGPVHAITTRLVSYHQADGREVVGYLAEPSDVQGRPVPGVLVVHEWWGLNANIEAMTRQLAEQGYAAFAVDLYNGRKGETPDEAGTLMNTALARPGELVANLRDGHAVLAKLRRAPKVATLGWCFGGSMALEASLALGRKVNATVVYYGKPGTDRAELAKLKGPVLGFFGGADTSIPLPTVRAFEAALKANRTPVTIEVYEEAGHAFANPSGQNYQPAAAEDAWAKTLAFLAANLR